MASSLNDKWTNQRTNKSKNEWMNKRTNERTNGWMDGWMDKKWMEIRMNERTNTRTHERATNDRRMNEWMIASMNRREANAKMLLHDQLLEKILSNHGYHVREVILPPSSFRHDGNAGLPKYPLSHLQDNVSFPGFLTQWEFFAASCPLEEQGSFS